jgi:hypothetical protein
MARRLSLFCTPAIAQDYPGQITPAVKSKDAPTAATVIPHGRNAGQKTPQGTVESRQEYTDRQAIEGGDDEGMRSCFRTQSMQRDPHFRCLGSCETQ